MSDISGTIRKVTLNGVTYRVPMDVNLTFNRSAYETEGIPSTGNTMMKKILRMPTVEGCVLLTNPEEAERLNSLAESIDNFTMSFELADGSIYRGNGQINYENWETEENRSTVTLIPDKALNAWTLFSP
jgi:hypothetical protein